MKLSEEQKNVLESILSKFQGFYYSDVFTTIGGYAGTGKTTLLCELRKEIYHLNPKIRVAFVSYTGKAASVLNEKLISGEYLHSTDFVGTIHKLLYYPITKFDVRLNKNIIIEWKKRDEINYDIIFIDEASMVSEIVWNDLKSLGIPIIAIGDHGQLPPIGSDFNLLKNPDFKLTQIHRQALDSPIIQLSILVRQNGKIPVNTFFSKDVFKLSWKNPLCRKIWDEKVVFDQDLVVLCAFNKTRCKLNSLIREKLNYTDRIPYPGEYIAVSYTHLTLPTIYSV